eukprot:gene13139-27790_t
MSAKIFDELRSAVETQFSQFIPFPSRDQMSGPLLMITMFAFVLCWGPMVLGLEVWFTDPLTTSRGAYTAFVASVAVAAPISIDVVLDIWTSYWLPNFNARKVESPRAYSGFHPISSYINITTFSWVYGYFGFIALQSRIIQNEIQIKE